MNIKAINLLTVTSHLNLFIGIMKGVFLVAVISISFLIVSASEAEVQELKQKIKQYYDVLFKKVLQDLKALKASGKKLTHEQSESYLFEYMLKASDELRQEMSEIIKLTNKLESAGELDRDYREPQYQMSPEMAEKLQKALSDLTDSA